MTSEKLEYNNIIKAYKLKHANISFREDNLLVLDKQSSEPVECPDNNLNLYF